MPTSENITDKPTLEDNLTLKDGHDEPILKNSKFVKISVEVEDTAQFTKNKRNLETSFRFPVLESFVDGGFKLPEFVDEETVELLLDYLVDGDDILVKCFEKNRQKFIAMGSTSMGPPELKDNFEGCLVGCLFSVTAFLIDDTLDNGVDKQGRASLDEKGLFAFIDMYTAILDKKPLEKYEKAVELHIKDPNILESFNSIFNLTKKCSNLLESSSSVYLDEKTRGYYINASRKTLLTEIWHYKFPLKKCNYSDDSMLALRKNTSAVVLSIELFALSLNIDLEENVRCDPIFCRVLEAGEFIAGIVNDIFSFSKEMADDASENTILNKFRNEGKIEEAFEFGVEKLKQEYKTYSVFSLRLREVHSKNVNLQKYLDLTDHAVNMSLPFHILNQRYKKTKCWLNGIPMVAESY